MLLCQLKMNGQSYFYAQLCTCAYMFVCSSQVVLTIRISRFQMQRSAFDRSFSEGYITFILISMTSIIVWMIWTVNDNPFLAFFLSLTPYVVGHPVEVRQPRQGSFTCAVFVFVFAVFVFVLYLLYSYLYFNS